MYEAYKCRCTKLKSMDDDDFSEEIQDIGTEQSDSVATTGGIFSVKCGRQSEWLGLRRQSGGLK
jgi:hypothetical protein